MKTGIRVIWRSDDLSSFVLNVILLSEFIHFSQSINEMNSTNVIFVLIFFSSLQTVVFHILSLYPT